MHSHHSHSGQFCRHAKDSLADVVAQAARKGFSVFGLSEHAPRYRTEDLFPEESDLTPRDLERAYLSFLAEAQALRIAYAASHPCLSLLIGAECDFISPADPAGLEALLDTHNEIDYLVGSVHHVGGVSIDFDRPTWSVGVRAVAAALGGGATVDAAGFLALPEPGPAPGSVPEDNAATPTADEIAAFVTAYLDAQHAMLARHQPEVVGHFDLCLLWTPALADSVWSAQGVWERVQRNIATAVAHGALFEANSAAIRKGWTTSYPTPRILREILRQGGRICLSDDSHGVAQVGLNYAPMRDYLVREGVDTVWHLVPAAQRVEGDQRVGRRGRVVARPVPHWQVASFWSSA